MTAAEDNYVRPPTHDEAISMAGNWMDRSEDIIRFLEGVLRKKTGRKRKLSVRGLLGVLAAWTLLHPQNDLIMWRVSQWGKGLSDEDLTTLGITSPLRYHHITYLVAQLQRRLRATDPTILLDDNGKEIVIYPEGDKGISAMMSAIIRGAIPEWITQPVSLALDSTDMPTHAYVYARNKHPDVEDEDLPVGGTEVTATVSSFGFPFKGPDNRKVCCFDWDARESYVTGKNGRKKTTFVGRDLHTLVGVPEVGEKPIPHLTWGANLVPAGYLHSRAALTLLDGIGADNYPSELINDGGYSYALYFKWAEQLGYRGIKQTFDLHPKQRGPRNGPLEDTIVEDGLIFSEHSLPDHLKNLEAKDRFDSVIELERKSGLFEERLKFALKPFSTKEVGNKLRYRGPVLTGEVRCPNNRESMKLDAMKYPTTQCKVGVHCWCNETRTLATDRETQFPAYGTSKHEKRYGRRTAVEASYSEMKYHRSKMVRHWSRLFGTVKNALLIAIGIGCVNIDIIRSGYRITDVDIDPAGEIPEYIPARPPQAKHREGRRDRKPKRPKQAPFPRLPWNDKPKKLAA